MLLNIDPYTDRAFFVTNFLNFRLDNRCSLVFEHQVSAFLLPLTGNSRELLLD